MDWAFTTKYIRQNLMTEMEPYATELGSLAHRKQPREPSSTLPAAKLSSKANIWFPALAARQYLILNEYTLTPGEEVHHLISVADPTRRR